MSKKWKILTTVLLSVVAALLMFLALLEFQNISQQIESNKQIKALNISLTDPANRSIYLVYVRNLQNLTKEFVFIALYSISVVAMAVIDVFIWKGYKLSIIRVHNKDSETKRQEARQEKIKNKISKLNEKLGN